MAVTFNWYRGTRAALAEAIRDLDARLAAVELLATGAVVSPAAVTATAAVPSPWVQDAIHPVAVAAAASVPSVSVRSAATATTTTVAATAAVPTPTVSVV